jgi:hypothetical protein
MWHRKMENEPNSLLARSITELLINKKPIG